MCIATIRIELRTLAPCSLGYAVGMSNSPDTDPQPSGSSGTPTTLIVVIAGACILVLGACVLCIGGGLALPIMQRKAAVEAERDRVQRADIEARDAAMQSQQSAEEQETLDREMESVRELKERGERSDQDATPSDGDDSTERAVPRDSGRGEVGAARRP